MENTKVVAPRIITVKDLLNNTQLRIPDYQRPYKWTSRNVNQLVDDVLHFHEIGAYRLGTIVLHTKGSLQNLVDGQQRTVTLMLIAYTILKRWEKEMPKIVPGLSLKTIEPNLKNLLFLSEVSANNIRTNLKEIEQRVREFSENHIRFFFDSCQLVEVTLTDISEAFQFFDSQNARGKDLQPHDLLKAFHLREMADSSTEKERIDCVRKWEAEKPEALAQLFENYLFRIRNWSKGLSARYFTKDDVSIFKGLSPSIDSEFPMAKSLRIIHFFVEGYNRSSDRSIDLQKMDYPFQIDQNIINGKRFFELTHYYSQLVKKVQKLDFGFGDSSEAKEIVKLLTGYSGSNRIGDRYVRNLFDCCLLYYVDKFGVKEIDRAILRFFLWSYQLRLDLQAVHLASIDNQAYKDDPLFKSIREAIHPKDFLNSAFHFRKEFKFNSSHDLTTLYKKLIGHESK